MLLQVGINEGNASSGKQGNNEEKWNRPEEKSRNNKEKFLIKIPRIYEQTIEKLLDESSL